MLSLHAFKIQSTLGDWKPNKKSVEIE